MAYELHLQRPESEGSSAGVSESSFAAAVEGSPWCRLASTDEAVATNPKTGEVIRIGGLGLRAEVQLSASPGNLEPGRQWTPVFRLHSGTVSFRASFDIDNPEDPVRRAAADLARRLGCQIVGDQGEEYSW